MKTVGLPGSDSEYFQEDYDTVHCMHGAFIGYPGGADYMCGLCENGQYYPKQANKWTLYVYGKKIGSVYRKEEANKWDKLIKLCDKNNVAHEVIQEVYTYWDDEK